MNRDSFWRKISESNLRQGDFLLNCPIPVFSDIPKEDLSLEVEIGKSNLIILTQSCDLENGKAELVALCPIYSLTGFSKDESI